MVLNYILVGCPCYFNCMHACMQTRHPIRANAMEPIEFLRLCQNFGLTPTFAKLDETKSTRWKQSLSQFVQNVTLEELRLKANKNATLKKQIIDVYDEIRQTCSLFRYLCILKTIVDLRNKQYHNVMRDHVSKIPRLMRREVDVDEHIQNISSYDFSFFQKLVLCRGLTSPLWMSKPILKKPTGN